MWLVMFVHVARFRQKVCSSREMEEISSIMTVGVLSLHVLHVVVKYIFLFKLGLSNF